jgi:large subunit ribosomal protein L30
VAKLAVIRIRGTVELRGDIKETLRMLGLTRVNHCVIIDDDPSYKGMLQKAKDYTTWGDARQDVVEALLRKRGRLTGDKKLSDEYVKSNTSFTSIADLAKAVSAGEFKLSALTGFKKVFRLHPPRKGYRATRRPFKDLGDLGYRGDKINELILRMI